MDSVCYAQINGVELRDMEELNGEEVLYRAKIYLDEKEIGTMEEDLEGGSVVLDVLPRYQDVLKSRINDYIKAMEMDGDEETPDRDIFFMDLIDMQIFYGMYREGLSEGYFCLVVDASAEDIQIYSVETEDDVEELIREKNLTDFEVYTSPKDFIISC
ncbi:hypothetical protein [Dethiosulfovibrio salsuginis]|uniref:Uncharacterized protein n=1 Tax=Dethiosulfovibrio salsuginis TaxID=561720 RepID=A0A1X7JVK6_9BACT|nr:hypothetical protein [Dethiosulfovibrio salsuginis]SMG32253.1 hypothetical protein SAMN06275492_11718 [Dethiosulfovibrio salsuginis]